MKITLGSDAEKLIEAKLKSGKYATPQDVVLAGLQTLERESHDEFAPGEMTELLAVADEQIEKGETLDGEQVLRELREFRERSRSKAG